MKRLIVYLLAVTTALTAVAQETIQVDVTKLDRTQLSLYQDLKKMQAGATSLENMSIDRLDRYSQIGKAFGSAFKECWSTVSTDAEKFAQSSTGKWAMVLVSWKIMGQDAIGLTRTIVQWIVGAILLVIGIPFFIFMVYRNCIMPPIQSIESNGLFKKKIVYMNRAPLHADIGILYGFCFIVYLGITSMITFIH
jgi:hypothetical protein